MEQHDCPECGSPERREIDAYRNDRTYVCTECGHVWNTRIMEERDE